MKEYQQNKHNDSGGNSTDENLMDVIQDSEEEHYDTFEPEAKQHYDNLSDSHQSPMDDEDEEEKLEQEITNNVSHLIIHRTSDDELIEESPHKRISPTRKDHKIMNWNQEWNRDKNNNNNNNNNNYQEENIEDDINLHDINHLDVGDEHYEAMFNNAHSVINGNINGYKFSLKAEFLSNETFLKYAMLYGTIYFISRYSLNRYYDYPIRIDTDNISRKIVLITNAVVSIFKGHDCWNKPHKAILSPFREALTENDRNFVDIQKAFYFIMLLLSYFGGKQVTRNKNIVKRLSRLYNLISIGCIILIKKYKKIGGLYIYTTFWMQLSSFFMNSSNILKSLSLSTARNNYYTKMMIKGSKSLSIIHALTMIYSRIYLFTKVMIPIIQTYYRNNNQYVGSIASIGFLLTGYYKAGDQIFKKFLEK